MRRVDAHMSKRSSPKRQSALVPAKGESLSDELVRGGRESQVKLVADESAVNTTVRRSGNPLARRTSQAKYAPAEAKGVEALLLSGRGRALVTFFTVSIGAAVSVFIHVGQTGGIGVALGWDILLLLCLAVSSMQWRCLRCVP
eukprot:Hpha_TRINITY_DN30480_c0_g1::TRINITY_DN30480_c0_g1_i1::g.168138::m.168138